MFTAALKTMSFLIHACFIKSLGINNLPFVVGSNFRQYGGDFGFYDVNPPANTCGYFIYLPPNGTNAYPYWTINGAAGTTVTGAHLYASNRTFWEGNITYTVD